MITDDLIGHMKTILYAAYKLDDKPHQLFSAIMSAAGDLGVELGMTPSEVAEVVRCSNEAYINAHKLGVK